MKNIVPAQRLSLVLYLIWWVVEVTCQLSALLLAAIIIRRDGAPSPAVFLFQADLCLSVYQRNYTLEVTQTCRFFQRLQLLAKE